MTHGPNFYPQGIPQSRPETALHDLTGADRAAHLLGAGEPTAGLEPYDEQSPFLSAAGHALRLPGAVTLWAPAGERLLRERFVYLTYPNSVMDGRWHLKVQATDRTGVDRPDSLLENELQVYALHTTGLLLEGVLEGDDQESWGLWGTRRPLSRNYLHAWLNGENPWFELPDGVDAGGRDNFQGYQQLPPDIKPGLTRILEGSNLNPELTD